MSCLRDRLRPGWGDNVRVIGIDVSLASTGVGIIDYAAEPLLARADTILTAGRRADNLVRRDTRLGEITAAVLGHTGQDTVLAVIEGPSLGSIGGSSHDRSGLWWRIVGHLHRRDIPVAIVAPTTLKKWATGSGRADKADVAVAMSRLWPAVDVPGNDGWDGLALAHMGAQALGWPVASRAHHEASLLKVDWSVAVPA